MKIDFYLFYELDIPTLAPIARALQRAGADAQFILEPPVAHPFYCNHGTQQRTANDYQTMLTLLRGSGFTALPTPRSDADVVAATQGVEWVFNYNCPKVRVMYGAGVVIPAGRNDEYSHGEVNRGCAAILAHGEYSARRLTAWCRPEDIYKVGFPKHAAALRGEYDRQALRRQFGLQPDRPVLVYLPTWANGAAKLGTLKNFSKAIAALGKKYQIVCKPHVHSLHYETADLEILRGAAGVKVIENEPNIGVFFIIADYILADIYSGSFTEALLFDRPLIGLAPADKRGTYRLVEGIEKAAPLCETPETLPDLLEDLRTGDKYREGRIKWARFIFEDHHGHDDEAAARALLDIAARKKSPPRALITMPLPAAVPQAKLISVIIPPSENPEMLADSLHALANQTLLPQQYEIILCLDTSTTAISPPENGRACLKRLPLPQQTGAWLQQALAAAEGRWVLFLSSNRHPDADLLENHIKVHAGIRQPDIIVIGDGILPPEVQTTPFGHIWRQSRIFGRASRIFYPRRFHGIAYASAYGSETVFIENTSFEAVALRRSRICETAFASNVSAGLEFALRLEQAHWRGLIYEPACRAVISERFDLEDFCCRNYLAGQACRFFMPRHPQSLRLNRQMHAITETMKIVASQPEIARANLAKLPTLLEKANSSRREEIGEEKFWKLVEETHRQLCFAADYHLMLGWVESQLVSRPAIKLAAQPI